MLMPEETEARIDSLNELARTSADPATAARMVPLEARNHVLREDEPAFSRFVDEIGRHLTVTEKAVRNCVYRIYRKLDVETRGQAIVMAREAGLGLSDRRRSRPSIRCAAAT